MKSRIYRTFSVGGDPDHEAFLSRELNDEMRELQNHGWNIENVNVNHIHKAWSCDQQKYLPTDEYIIVCTYKENT